MSVITEEAITERVAKIYAGVCRDGSSEMQAVIGSQKLLALAVGHQDADKAVELAMRALAKKQLEDGEGVTFPNRDDFSTALSEILQQRKSDRKSGISWP